jgi:cytochrome P450 family 4
MGVKLDTMSKSDEYRENIHKIGVKMLYRLLRPWLYSDFVYKLLGQRSQLDKLCKAVHSFTEKVIKHRRTVFLEGQNEVQPLLAGDNM